MNVEKFLDTYAKYCDVETDEESSYYRPKDGFVFIDSCVGFNIDCITIGVDNLFCIAGTADQEDLERLEGLDVYSKSTIV